MSLDRGEKKPALCASGLWGKAGGDMWLSLIVENCHCSSWQVADFQTLRYRWASRSTGRRM